jgi:hypothetical protein
MKEAGATVYCVSQTLPEDGRPLADHIHLSGFDEARAWACSPAPDMHQAE